MRELSLHILDLVENSTRAGASVVSISVNEDTKGDRLEIRVEDNGPGLQVSPEKAVDPFYTTKRDKRVGLGISLLRSAAEHAGGAMELGTSSLGGLAVKVTMQLSHVDRVPMGDLAGTISAVVCTNPDLDLRCSYGVDGSRYVLRTLDVAKELLPTERTGLNLSELVSQKIAAALAAITVTA